MLKRGELPTLLTTWQSIADRYQQLSTPEAKRQTSRFRRLARQLEAYIDADQCDFAPIRSVRVQPSERA